MGKYIVYFILFYFILSACSDEKKSLMIESYMQSFKEVKNSTLNIDQKLSPIYITNRGAKSSFIIVNFINTECGVCYTKMDDWKNLLYNYDINAHVLFITSGKITNYFNDYLKSNLNLPFSIYMDSSKQTLINAKLLALEKETFLVNKHGEILLVGDPLTNKMIYNFYQDITSE